MEKILIRKAVKDDIKDIIIIEEASFKVPWSYKSYLKEIEENSLAIYLCACQDEQLIGYAGMWAIEDEGHITRIAVSPKMRNKGIGYSLVNSLIEEGYKSNISSLTLEVRQGNIPAVKMYKKAGFIIEGIRKQYYSDNKENALIMWKR